MLKVNVIIICAIVLLYYALSQKYPDFLSKDAIADKLLPQKKNPLDSIDIDSLTSTIQRLMKEDKVYRDEEISLAKLSSLADITPHQLSWFLNEHYNKNYNSFINAYRINEAISKINADKSINLTGLAYDVGFNSYYTFNAAFKKETGLSPAAFKKNL